MKIDTVSELLERSEGTVPEAFRGKITKVGKRNTGDGQYGPYSLQKVTIRDEKGAEIQVLLDGRDELTTSAVGSEMYAEATRGDRGLQGLKRQVDKYKDRTTQQVKVTSSAKLSIADTPANGTATKPADTTKKSDPAPTGNGNGSNGHANGNGNGNGNGASHVTREDQLAIMRGFDKALARNMSALQRCLDAAFEVVRATDLRHKDAGGFKPSQDGIKELGVTLFIQTCWSKKAGEIDGFPVKTFQDVQNAAEKDGIKPAAAAPKGCPF